MTITVATLRERKERGEKITMVTAYAYPSARLADEAGVELILVGSVFTLARFSEGFLILRALDIGVSATLSPMVLVAFKPDLAAAPRASVPGTVGGNVFMNAGTYWGEVGPLVEEVKILDGKGSERILDRGKLKFEYRRSNIPPSAGIPAHFSRDGSPRPATRLRSPPRRPCLRTSAKFIFRGTEIC